MILQEADITTLETSIGLDLDAREYSWILDGNTQEGRLVQSWLRSLDLAFIADMGCASPPAWIASHFKWGPHKWPIRWADIPKMQAIDCGAFAAIATAVISWRGASAFPVQLVLRFTHDTVNGWQALWDESGVECHWSAGIFAYHEATLVIMPSGIARIWDPLGGFWLPIIPEPGYEGVVALRFHGRTSFDTLIQLASQSIRSGTWYSISGGLHTCDGMSAVGPFTRPRMQSKTVRSMT